MADQSIIAWTDHTWNPWMGCAKVSQGCKYCYAEALTRNRMGIDVFGPGERRRTSVALWKRPLRWEREALLAGERRRVFCASLADVFEDHPGPNAWRPDVFARIRECPSLDFQLLTKRPENLPRMLPDDWDDGYPNVWLGTSIEDDRVVERAELLKRVPAVVHFVSYEPAIGPLEDIDLTDIEWLICGGESGPGYRPMDLDWVRSIRRRCDNVGTAFFFKQSSAIRTEMGIELDGEIVRNYPRSRSLVTA